MAHTQADAKFLRLKWRLAFVRWQRTAERWVATIKANFDPNQPRVPAGNPDGGQWTSTGGGEILSDASPDTFTKPSAQVAQAGPRTPATSSIRVGGRRLPATPGQAMRFGAADRRARRLTERVREIDPTWKPQASLTDPSSIAGAIATRLGEAREAEARLWELAQQSPSQLIHTYRTLNNSIDLFGGETWPRNRDTVAIATLGRTPFTGVSLSAPTYTLRDREAACRAVEALAVRYPETMNTRNFGGLPNNALYHAEATILLRVARAHRGSLAEQRFEVHTDREMCLSCEKVLPLLGRELGNPTVTFVSPSGARNTMRDGRWLD